MRFRGGCNALVYADINANRYMSYYNTTTRY